MQCSSRLFARAIIYNRRQLNAPSERSSNLAAHCLRVSVDESVDERALEHLAGRCPLVVVAVPVAPLCGPDLDREGAGTRRGGTPLETILDELPCSVDDLGAGLDLQCLFVVFRCLHCFRCSRCSDAGADQDIAMQDGGIPWFIAPRQGRQEVVCLLSDAGADKDIAMQGGATPLSIASQSGHLEVACLLSEAGADKDIHRNAGSHHFLEDATSKGVAPP